MDRFMGQLDLMVAFLDRVDRICVYVDCNYYQGNVSAFYLVNVDTQTVEVLQIDESFQRDNTHVYFLKVDEVKLGYAYEIRNNYGLVRSLEPRGIVNDPLFDTYYAYTDDDLGSYYTKEKTTFKVWTPLACRVYLEYIKNDEIHTKQMKRTGSIYEVTVEDDLDGCNYNYVVSHNGRNYSACVDPYGYSSSENGRYSCVIDLEKITKKTETKSKVDKADAIIYETSIRDFTSLLDVEHPGTFESFTKKGLTSSKGHHVGFDYLLDLGVSHIQLMPIHDFTSVDETQEVDLYNWGYDPEHFGVVEGMYCINPKDPYKRINECIEMINTCHHHDLHVVMDLVFNHVYDVKRSSFQTLVPYYYFRNDDKGIMSNGSFCSNDINSASLMVRKYLVDMSKRWQDIYGVDGFRFDLMGILDVDTMDEIASTCLEKNPYFLIYGEGWNMPTMLLESKKAMLDNFDALPTVGFFNDYFRNVIKGPNQYDYQNIGYFSGNNGSFDAFRRMFVDRIQRLPIEQSINYIACHDNMTLFDYLTYYLKQEQSEAVKRQSILNAILILLPGTTFIHSGQEFCRTKKGNENSYNAGDGINGIDWEYKDYFLAEVHWVKQLISYRGQHPILRSYDVNNISIHQNDAMQCIVEFNDEDERIVIVCNLKGYVTTFPLGDLQVALSSCKETVEEDEQLLLSPYSVVVLDVTK